MIFGGGDKTVYTQTGVIDAEQSPLHGDQSPESVGLAFDKKSKRHFLVRGPVAFLQGDGIVGGHQRVGVQSMTEADFGNLRGCEHIIQIPPLGGVGCHELGEGGNQVEDHQHEQREHRQLVTDKAAAAVS
jgi:hypothetical protein